MRSMSVQHSIICYLKLQIDAVKLKISQKDYSFQQTLFNIIKPK